LAGEDRKGIKGMTEEEIKQEAQRIIGYFREAESRGEDFSAFAYLAGRGTRERYPQITREEVVQIAVEAKRIVEEEMKEIE